MPFGLDDNPGAREAEEEYYKKVELKQKLKKEREQPILAQIKRDAAADAKRREQEFKQMESDIQKTWEKKRIAKETEWKEMSADEAESSRKQWVEELQNEIRRLKSIRDMNYPGKFPLEDKYQLVVLEKMVKDLDKDLEFEQKSKSSSLTSFGRKGDESGSTQSNNGPNIYLVRSLY